LGTLEGKELRGRKGGIEEKEDWEMKKG